MNTFSWTALIEPGSVRKPVPEMVEPSTKVIVIV